MKHLKVFGLAMVAMFVLSAAAVSSASAAELEFLASKTGLLLGELVGGPHKFATNAGTVECELAKADGSITATATLLQLAVVNYGECKVTVLNLGATITPVHYLFHTNGNVTLDNLVLVNAGSGACLIHVAPQVLSGITYANIAGPPMELEVKANVSNISYTLSGSFCLTATGKFANGTYKGNELTKEDGGELLID